MAESKARSSKRFIDSDRVEGTAVYTVDDKHIGTIKRFVIERQSGRIAYVVMSFGGFLDLGQETYTIPWGKLTYDVGVGASSHLRQRPENLLRLVTTDPTRLEAAGLAMALHSTVSAV